MDVIDNKTTAELNKSLLAEIAKAKNELRCAKQDVDKALNRCSFAIMVLNTLIDRDNTPN